MSRIWIISDMHLGDENITQWSGRPADWAEKLRHELHAHLQAGDTLIDLGDTYVGQSSGEHFEEHIKGLIPEGVEWIALRGNHDRVPASRYRAAGIVVLQAVVIQNLYLSHHGTRTLPDDARGQVLGHYHRNPPNPELPHALRFSLEEQQMRPVLLEKILRQMMREKLLRELPQRVDDRWFLTTMDRLHPWQDGDVVMDPHTGLKGVISRSEANRCTVSWAGELQEERHTTSDNVARPGQNERMQPERARGLIAVEASSTTGRLSAGQITRMKQGDIKPHEQVALIMEAMAQKPELKERATTILQKPTPESLQELLIQLREPQ